MKKDVRLKKQLRAMGAGEFESKDLSKLAGQLGGLKFRGLSREARDEIARIPDGKKHFYVPMRWAMAGSMAIVIVGVVFFSQTAKPGTALYAVKRGTEKARTVVQPSYTDTIVETRKEEVQELQKEAAPAPKLKKAEDDLKKAQEKASKRKQSSSKQTTPRTTNNKQDQTRTRSRWNWRNNSSSGSSSTPQTENTSGSTNSGSSTPEETGTTTAPTQP